MRYQVVATLVLVAWTAAVGQEATEPLSAEQKSIRQNAESFVAAFDKGDATAVAALWAENGEMSLDGETVAVGRDQIAQQYAQYFQQNPGARIEVQIESIRVLGPTLAVERGHSEVINDDEETVIDAYRLIYTKQGDQWLVVSADVQQEEIESPYDWKADLGFLVGKWTASEADWGVSTEIEWVPGGNFLKRTFSVREGDQEERTGVQIIGWDALEQSVVSWTFGADGGHGRGWWQPDGNQWFIETEGVSPNGEVITANNVITVLDDNAFRWQSVDRTVAGVALEDTEPVTVKRVTSDQ